MFSLYTRTDDQKFVGLALHSSSGTSLRAESKVAAPRTLIRHLRSSLALALRDFDKPIFVSTDVSGAAVGDMPSQMAIDWKDR